jgi:RNA polymerase sigma-70 factor (ECF subfamily)
MSPSPPPPPHATTNASASETVIVRIAVRDTSGATLFHVNWVVVGAGELAQRFLRGRETAGVGAAELATLLDERLAVARRAWPELPEDDAGFVDFLGQRVPPGAPLPAALAALHVEDLYLVFGCLRGQRRALEIFDERLLRPAVNAATAAAAERDELLQAVAERLLVDGEGSPRIAEYAGRGRLSTWVRVTVLRAHLNRRRGRTPAASVSVDGVAGGGDDPERALERGGAQRELARALKRVLAGLPAGERVLLRMYFFDGMTVEELGRLHRVSKATMSRRLAALRERVHDETRRSLREELRLLDGDVDSLTRAALSQLDTSLRGVLG